MRVRVQDFEMEYEVAGTGRPVLCVHGYPLHHEMWLPQLEGLAHRARVLAPDLRGHGKSDPATGPYTMDTLADDLRALLDALGIRQPVVLCGLSMGGYVTFAFCRGHADRVAGLILAATRSGADSPDGRAHRDRAIGLAREEGVRAVAASILPKMLAPGTYETRPELVEQVRAMMERTSLDGVVGDLVAMRDRVDSTPTLARIDKPTLIVHGADDQLIPLAEAEAMHVAAPGSRLHVLPGAGHLPNLEQPDSFNAAVSEYLQRL